MEPISHFGQESNGILYLKKSPPVQLTEFMDKAKVPLGCDKVICWGCCIQKQLIFDANQKNNFVISQGSVRVCDSVIDHIDHLSKCSIWLCLDNDTSKDPKE